MAVFLAALCTSAAAEPVGHGSSGLDMTPFSARNRGPLPMTCMVETAHFYSVDLGLAASGARVTRRFWTAERTGEIFVLNAHHDRMPVQSLWCGIAGHAWETRAVIPLDHRAGLGAAPLRFECRSDRVLHCDAHSTQQADKVQRAATSP